MPLQPSKEETKLLHYTENVLFVKCASLAEYQALRQGTVSILFVGHEGMYKFGKKFYYTVYTNFQTKFQ